LYNGQKLQSDATKIYGANISYVRCYMCVEREKYITNIHKIIIKFYWDIKALYNELD